MFITANKHIYNYLYEIIAPYHFISADTILMHY